MSLTISVDVVGPRRWAYMAGLMAAHLSTAIATGTLNSDLIPRGVKSLARKFFNLVKKDIEGSSDNPPATARAHLIALDVLQASSPSLTDDQLAERLLEYATFIGNLGTSRDLRDEERPTVLALRDFFLRLQREGETERYVDAIALEEPSRVRQMFRQTA